MGDDGLDQFLGRPAGVEGEIGDLGQKVFPPLEQSDDLASGHRPAMTAPAGPFEKLLGARPENDDGRPLSQGLPAGRVLDHRTGRRDDRGHMVDSA